MGEQLDLIVAITGGQIWPRAMLPAGNGTLTARLVQLAASGIGFVKSRVRPSMAILGDRLSWGVGDIRLLPKINFGTYFREVSRGRPVIFVQRPDGKSFSALMECLNFDPTADAQTLLNGNDCLAFFGSSGGRKVFAHVGRSNHGKSAVNRHYEGLACARASLAHASLIRVIATPEPIHSHGGAIVFTQSCLEGDKIDLPTTPPEEFYLLLERAFRPLLEIHKETFRPEGMPEQRFIKRMRSDLANVTWSPSIRSSIIDVIDGLEKWLENRNLGTVCVHGDYTFSNLLFDRNKEVSAIVDWEWTRGNGCPGYDAMHLGLAAAGSQFSIPVLDLTAAVVGGSDLPRPLEQYFETVLPKLGLRAADIAPLATLSWLSTVFRSSVWTPASRQDWLMSAIAPMLKVLR